MIVHVGWNDTDTDTEHDLGLRLETEDGQPVPIGTTPRPDGAQQAIVQIGQRFIARRPPLLRAGDEQTHTVSYTVNDLRLDRPGGYSWVLVLNGEIAHRLSMRVIAAKPH